MSSLNKVILIGRLGQDPELRYTSNQTPIAQLSIATSEKNKEGRETVEWHRVNVWGNQAEACGKYLAKGRQVYVEGKITTRSWVDKNSGDKRYSTEINASHVGFLGDNQNAQQQQPQQVAPQQQQRQPAPQQQWQPGPPSLDDIPF